MNKNAKSGGTQTTKAESWYIYLWSFFEFINLGHALVLEYKVPIFVFEGKQITTSC